MKIKGFTQFIKEEVNWNKGGAIAELLRRIASSAQGNGWNAQDNGWNGYVGVSNDELAIFASDSWTEEDLDYCGDSVDCNIKFECTLKPIFSEEYADSAELGRLLDLGLAEMSSIITGFEATSSFTVTCKDVWKFNYARGGETNTLTIEDLSGGNSDLSDPEAFGSDLAETLNEWINEYTFGNYYRVEVEKELFKYCREEDADDDKE